MITTHAITIILVLLGIAALISCVSLAGFWLGNKLNFPNIKLPRLFFMMTINAMLLGLIYFIAPQQLAVTLYKVLLLTLAAFIAYWIDRAAFPYARPHEFKDNDILLFTLSMLRRAVIIGCAMIAVELGA